MGIETGSIVTNKDTGDMGEVITYIGMRPGLLGMERTGTFHSPMVRVKWSNGLEMWHNAADLYSKEDYR